MCPVPTPVNQTNTHPSYPYNLPILLICKFILYTDDVNRIDAIRNSPTLSCAPFRLLWTKQILIPHSYCISPCCGGYVSHSGGGVPEKFAYNKLPSTSRRDGWCWRGRCRSLVGQKTGGMGVELISTGFRSHNGCDVWRVGCECHFISEVGRGSEASWGRELLAFSPRPPIKLRSPERGVSGGVPEV